MIRRFPETSWKRWCDFHPNYHVKVVSFRDIWQTGLVGCRISKCVITAFKSMVKLLLVFFQTSWTENYRARTRTRGPGIQYRGRAWESPWRPANLRQNCLPDWRCGPWWTTETWRSDYSCEWREPRGSRARVCSVYVEENQGKNYSYSAFIKSLEFNRECNLCCKATVTAWAPCAYFAVKSLGVNKLC